jgi:gliding motility-associated-like protein
MKKLLLCAFLFAANCKTFSQTVLNTSGQTLQNTSVSVEYSIGEISIATVSGSQQYATQGLLQPILLLKDCNLLNFIPSAFTPNKDNLNDCFGIKNWPATSSFELCIYNRWGEMVFQSTNMLGCWNGEFRGQPQPTGTYVYTIKANTSTCGFVTNKGTVTIIR